MREEIRVSAALFGLGLIGIGLLKIYQPIAMIYFGLVIIWFANKGAKEDDKREK
jgi:hypothetical protein